MALLWLPEAKADVERLFDFLITKNPAAAERAVRCIAEGALKLEDFGDIGRPMEDDTQRRELFLPFGASHYVLRYRRSGENIVIIRVWHAKEMRP